jgi:iron complex transport system substrate-binding protein
MTATARMLIAIAATGHLLAAAAPAAVQNRGGKFPGRIVSIVPAVTEMLFALKAGDRVVGVGSFDTFPPEAQHLPRVGALLDPDLERILALRPDLVVVYGSQSDLRRQLERAGIATFVYAHAGLAEVTGTIRELGVRLGTNAQASRLAADIDARLREIRAAVASRQRPRTLLVLGRENLALRGIYASGGVGFVHDMLTAAGGENVFGDVQRESVQATTELIIARRPDVILELRAEPLDAERIKRELDVWHTLASVPAVRSGRVHILSDRRTVIPGPRVAEGVEAIARALHLR